jgi:hypothetical protein
MGSRWVGTLSVALEPMGQSTVRPGEGCGRAFKGRKIEMLQNDAGKIAVTLSQGQTVSLVHPDGTVCVVAPTPKQVGKCHLVIIAPKTVRIERDQETADEIVRLRAERDEARRKYNEAKARIAELLGEGVGPHY